MPNGWRTINSLVHKIRLHGRRGKGMAESFSRQKSRHAPQKEGGLKILCDLPPVWPRLVRPTNLMSRMNGKKTHTHAWISMYLHSSLSDPMWISPVSPSINLNQILDRNKVTSWVYFYDKFPKLLVVWTVCFVFMFSFCGFVIASLILSCPVDHVYVRIG